MKPESNYVLTKQQAAEYYKRSAETAMYPDKLVYVCLGLNGEAGELHELIESHTAQFHCQDENMRKQIISEIGDIFWYIAAFYRENPEISDFAGVTAIISRKEYEHRNCHLSTLILTNAVKISEYMKKLLRLRQNKDSEIRQNKIIEIIENMYDTIELITQYLFQIIREYEIPINKVLDTNIQKLSERKSAGTLMSR